MIKITPSNIETEFRFLVNKSLQYYNNLGYDIRNILLPSNIILKELNNILVMQGAEAGCFTKDNKYYIAMLPMASYRVYKTDPNRFYHNPIHEVTHAVVQLNNLEDLD